MDTRSTRTTTQNRVVYRFVQPGNGSTELASIGTFINKPSLDWAMLASWYNVGYYNQRCAPDHFAANWAL